MTGLVTSGEKRLVLVSGRAHIELAQQVGEELGCGVSPTTAYDFASGETYVRFNESVRGADVFVLQSHTGEVNKWLMEQLLMIDAAKRASAKRITAVAPYYPYARQDKKHLGREPISARLIADLYKTAGADRIMSVDLHASQEQGFFDGPVDHLWRCPSWLTTCARALICPMSAWSRPTPVVSASPRSGQQSWVDAPWLSSTRLAILPAPMSLLLTALLAMLRVSSACWSMT